MFITFKNQFKLKKTIIIFLSIIFINGLLVKAQTVTCAFGINGYGIKSLSTCFYDSSTSVTSTYIVSRTWNFGDGTGNIVVSPATTTVTPHTFTSAGTYMVKLIVTNNLGNADSLTKSVLIKDIKMPQLYIYQTDTNFQTNQTYTTALGYGQFYTKRSTFCDDTANYTNFASIAYRKWKFYDPATTPGDTSLLKNATNVYTVPAPIRIVYYFAFINPAGTCGNGSGGLQLDSIVSTGSGSCYDMATENQPYTFHNTFYPNSPNPICPTDSFYVNLQYLDYQPQCFNSNVQGPESWYVNGAYTDLSNNVSSFATNNISTNLAAGLYLCNLSNPGTYTFYAQAYPGIDPYGNHYVGIPYTVTVTTCSSAGIEQLTTTNDINVYPNPNNGSFIVEKTSIKEQAMRIFDVTGKMVLMQTISGKTVIDASSLNEGVYNISIIGNDGVANKRLVIVR